MNVRCRYNSGGALTRNNPKDLPNPSKPSRTPICKPLFSLFSYTARGSQELWYVLQLSCLPFYSGNVCLKVKMFGAVSNTIDVWVIGEANYIIYRWACHSNLNSTSLQRSSASEYCFAEIGSSRVARSRKLPLPFSSQLHELFLVNAEPSFFFGYCFSLELDFFGKTKERSQLCFSVTQNANFANANIIILVIGEIKAINALFWL